MWKSNPDDNRINGSTVTNKMAKNLFCQLFTWNIHVLLHFSNTTPPPPLPYSLFPNLHPTNYYLISTSHPKPPTLHVPIPTPHALLLMIIWCSRIYFCTSSLWPVMHGLHQPLKFTYCSCSWCRLIVIFCESIKAIFKFGEVSVLRFQWSTLSVKKNVINLKP